MNRTLLKKYHQSKILFNGELQFYGASLWSYGARSSSNVYLCMYVIAIFLKLLPSSLFYNPFPIYISFDIVVKFISLHLCVYVY